MATKRSIADQVLLRISKGYPDASGAVQLPDVIMAVGQMANSLLKTQHFSQTLQMGETIPDNLSLMTYPDLQVKAMAPYGGMGARSYVDLPAAPVSLPTGIGIFNVASEKFTFIPMLPGQTYLLQGQDYICDLLGNVGYEPAGLRLVFTKDLTLENVTSVTVTLVGIDIDTLSEYDLMPLDKGMEHTIVEELVKSFAPSQTNNDQVDSVDTEKLNK